MLLGRQLAGPLLCRRRGHARKSGLRAPMCVCHCPSYCDHGRWRWSTTVSSCFKIRTGEMRILVHPWCGHGTAQQLRKSVWSLPKTFGWNCRVVQHFHFWVYDQENWKHRDLGERTLHIHIQGSTMHRRPEGEPQMCTGRGAEKHEVLCPHRALSPTLRKTGLLPPVAACTGLQDTVLSEKSRPHRRQAVWSVTETEGRVVGPGAGGAGRGVGVACAQSPVWGGGKCHGVAAVTVTQQWECVWCRRTVS